MILPDDVVVEVGLDGGRGWQLCSGIPHHLLGGQLIANDVIAKVYAFIADENGWPSYQLFDFMLTFAAKRAIQGFFCSGAFFSAM